MKGMGTLLSVFVIVIGLSVCAHGTLVDMHDGTIYDTNTQLSWLKDASAGGRKPWDQAVAWAASLNAGSGFAGLTGWRLPNADPACPIGYNCVNSEMGHLYYTELRNAAQGPLTNAGPFVNLERYYYWSGTEYGPDPTTAWTFNFTTGAQEAYPKTDIPYAWAARPGARSR